MLGLAPAPAHALDEMETCAEPASDDEVRERLAWLKTRLSRGALGAASWWAGWLSYASAEASYGWLRYGASRDRLDRDLWLVTGLGSSLWVGQLLVFPMSPAYASLRMEGLATTSASERRRALVRAERLLRDAARTEQAGRHWSEHVLDLGWALGSAAYIFGRSYGREPSARVVRETGLELGLTILLSEAAILTTPRQALRDLAAYRARCHGDEAEKRAHEPARRRSWSLQLRASGAAVSLRF
ncbi:MAG: hypothetical protein JWN48_136 [Myxococcaceae bacterium]|nr:hypothetical protein [Myxococcaceae bacterium]